MCVESAWLGYVVPLLDLWGLARPVFGPACVGGLQNTNKLCAHLICHLGTFNKPTLKQMLLSSESAPPPWALRKWCHKHLSPGAKPFLSERPPLILLSPSAIEVTRGPSSYTISLGIGEGRSEAPSQGAGDGSQGLIVGREQVAAGGWPGWTLG